MKDFNQTALICKDIFVVDKILWCIRIIRISKHLQVKSWRIIVKYYSQIILKYVLIYLSKSILKTIFFNREVKDIFNKYFLTYKTFTIFQNLHRLYTLVNSLILKHTLYKIDSFALMSLLGWFKNTKSLMQCQVSIITIKPF